MRKLINSILIIIIICCLSYIGNKFYKYNKDKALYSEIQDLAPVISEVNPTNDEDKLIDDEDQSKDNEDEGILNENKNEEELKSINSNYKMWIQIENTEINYPIVQGEDNEYYLKHNFKNESNISGTLFVECTNNIDEDKNIIIYGHNMRNGTMFKEITNYKEKDFFNNNNKINIIKDNKVYQYEVISVYVQDEKDVELSTKFIDNEEFINYVSDEISKSMYKKDINITEDDSILTLVTCSYEFDGARTIVVARCN